MKRLARIFAIVAIVASITGAAAVRGQQSHVLSNVPDAKWGPAPPMLPPGAEIAVLAGNPTAAGAYVVRLRFPANYMIPAHSHPTDENVVVVSGSFAVGMGDKLDKTAGTMLAPGGFAMLPAGMNHFAYSKAATTIVLFGNGPVEFKYVNPKDDPRHK
jgi:quercetin dioxygenase-like cupin family protein